MPRAGSHLLHGAIGGFLAGAFVALWFFVRDVVTTEPFHTPAVLASTIVGYQVVAPTFRLVATYTVLHFAVFVVLGLGISAFMRAVAIAPSLPLGVLFGLGVLNTVHYGSLLVVHSDFLTALPVPHVVVANLLAGLALMAYLHYAAYREVPFGPGVIRTMPLLAQGLVTGLIGAGAVALWLFVVDVLTSRPFYTPAALGSAVFLGARAPGEVRVTPGVIAAYTALHVAAFALVGVAFTWAVQRLERAPGAWLIVLMASIVLEGLFVGAVGSVGAWVLGAIGWWAIGAGNLLAVAAMAVWLLRSHPALARKLMEEAVATRV
jgi:hypothetical protein